MKKILSISLVAVLFAWPVSTLAAEFKAGDAYSLSRGDSIRDDLYVAAGSITISGAVSGDLIAAGGNVTVTGSVAEDATIAGGTVSLGGSTGGDARVGGGNVTIDGAVADDLFVGGGQVHLTAGSVVNGDVVVAGGQVTLDGRVSGSVRVTGGQIKVGDTAVIAGDFSYKSSREAEIAEGARISGAISFNQMKRYNSEFQSFAVAAFVIKTIIFAIMGALLVLIFRTKAPRVVHQALSKFWPNILRGFLVLIAVPVALILVCFTIVGIPLAIIALLGYIAWMILAGIGGGVVFGSWLARMTTKKDPAPVTWKWAVLGVTVLSLIQLIPVVGWIASCIFFLVTLGSIAKLWYDTAWMNR